MSYTTPEPEPSIEYRQYMEQQLNNTNVDEDFLLSPSSSSHVKDKWATSFSTPGSAHSAIVKGKFVSLKLLQIAIIFEDSSIISSRIEAVQLCDFKELWEKASIEGIDTQFF